MNGVTLRLNGQVPNDMIITSSVPNIVEVQSSGIYRPQSMDFDCAGWENSLEDNIEYYFTLNGYTVYATRNQSEASNRTFYISTDLGSSIINLMNALRNIPNINSNYNFMFNDGSSTFMIRSKNENLVGFMDWDTNLPMEDDGSERQGENTDPLFNSTVYLDIRYISYDTYQNGLTSRLPRIIGNTVYSIDYYIYLTTLEKKYYKGGIRFDISSIIDAITSYDSLTDIFLDCYCIDKDGDFQPIGFFNKLFAIKGYKGIDSKYSTNYNLGNSGTPQNNMSLMIPKLTGTSELTNSFGISSFNRSISFSVVYNSKIFDLGNRVPYKVFYYYSNNTMDTLATETLNFNATTEMINKRVITATFSPTQSKINSHAYCMIQGNMANMSFELKVNFIHPQYNVTQVPRIEWRNECGGLSFADFVGKEKNNFKISNTTYEENTLNAYLSTRRGTYISEVTSDETFTITSHIVHKNDLDYYKSMALSHYTNLVIFNGTTVSSRTPIVIENINIEEVAEDAFQVSVEYKLANQY